MRKGLNRMNNYVKYANRDEFQYECVEYGDYGSIEIEEVIHKNGKGKITKMPEGFSAECGSKIKPFLGEREFKSGRSARLWIEGMLKS